MKNNLIIPIVALIAQTAFSETTLQKTSFWQIQVPTQQVIKIEPLDPTLSKVCKEYSDLVISEPGKTSFDPAEIKLLREETSVLQNYQFTTQFRISIEPTQLLVKKSLEEIGAKEFPNASSELLPSYFQKPTTFNIQIQASSPLQVVSKFDSLTAISKSVGLLPLPITLRGHDLSSTVQVIGKDTACDLLSGAASLNFDSTASANIADAELQKMSQLYRQIELATKEAFSRKQASLSRAAILGFKLANILEPLSLTPEKGSDIVGNLIDQLFDLNMKPNQVWTSNESERHLIVPSSVSFPIKLRMEK